MNNEATNEIITVFSWDGAENCSSFALRSDNVVAWINAETGAHFKGTYNHTTKTIDVTVSTAADYNVAHAARFIAKFFAGVVR